MPLSIISSKCAQEHMARWYRTVFEGARECSNHLSVFICRKKTHHQSIIKYSSKLSLCLSLFCFIVHRSFLEMVKILEKGTFVRCQFFSSQGEMHMLCAMEYCQRDAVCFYKVKYMHIPSYILYQSIIFYHFEKNLVKRKTKQDYRRMTKCLTFCIFSINTLALWFDLWS